MKNTYQQKYIHASPKKIRFYLAAIKKTSPKEALTILAHTNGRIAKVLYKAIKSSYDSFLYNNKIQQDNVKFASIIVNQGPVLKRFRAGGRGVAKSYKRRTSHIKIALMITKTDKLKPVKSINETKQLPVKFEKKSVTTDKKNGSKS